MALEICFRFWGHFIFGDFGDKVFSYHVETFTLQLWAAGVQTERAEQNCYFFKLENVNRLTSIALELCIWRKM